MRDRNQTTRNLQTVRKSKFHHVQLCTKTNQRRPTATAPTVDMKSRSYQFRDETQGRHYQFRDETQGRHFAHAPTSSATRRRAGISPSPSTKHCSNRTPTQPCQ